MATKVRGKHGSGQEPRLKQEWAIWLQMSDKL
jgi:hypothetical protein